ncbi:Thioredoxin-like 1-3 [Cardamine amara subsp. amara]|uniref:Thioredoxin-like 1-3 n=1 Tax=Cardamine amara subsp. amara TaxID=228776 RepID=A0ABD1AH86_CARAN
MATDSFIKLTPISINRTRFNIRESPCISHKRISSLCCISPRLTSSNHFSPRTLISGENDNILFPKKKIPAIVRCQSSLGIGRNQKWWEKELKPNMKSVTSPEDLVNGLLNAGDKLVVVDFFSPGCGGCKALHPKICKIAEKNPEVEFLQVNYEEQRSLCQSLNVHVLPFFRFYRGSSGRVCNFSCTNATIKKFKEALEKHGREQCSIGETKGLEEKELVAMAANKDLSFDYKPKSNGEIQEQKEKDRFLSKSPTSKGKEVEHSLLAVSPAGIV